MEVNAPPFLIMEETVMVPEFQISAYPKDLASFLRERWQEERDQAGASLPDLKVLEHLISICYQASLLREEDRPVRFRAIFLPLDHFPSDLGPPAEMTPSDCTV
jgi:hypothetical protein